MTVTRWPLGQPVRDQAVEDRAGASRLRVGPVAVGEHEDVARRGRRHAAKVSQQPGGSARGPLASGWMPRPHAHRRAPRHGSRSRSSPGVAAGPERRCGRRAVPGPVLRPAGGSGRLERLLGLGSSSGGSGLSQSAPSSTGREPAAAPAPRRTSTVPAQNGQLARTGDRPAPRARRAGTAAAGRRPRAAPVRRMSAAERAETTGAAETEAARGRSSRSTLRPGDVVLLSRRAGHRQDDVRARRLPRARRPRAGDQPDVHASPAATRTGRVPVSHLDLYRLGGRLRSRTRRCSTRSSGPDRIAFVEWPEAAEPQPGRARASPRACAWSTPAATAARDDRAGRAMNVAGVRHRDAGDGRRACGIGEAPALARRDDPAAGARPGPRRAAADAVRGAARARRGLGWRRRRAHRRRRRARARSPGLRIGVATARALAQATGVPSSSRSRRSRRSRRGRARLRGSGARRHRRAPRRGVRRAPGTPAATLAARARRRSRRTACRRCADARVRAVAGRGGRGGTLPRPARAGVRGRRRTTTPRCIASTRTGSAGWRARGRAVGARASSSRLPAAAGRRARPPCRGAHEHDREPRHPPPHLRGPARR